MKWKRGTFKIASNPNYPGPNSDERKGVFTDVFGIAGNKYGYTVTHLPTGLKCAKANSQRQAKNKVDKLLAVPGVDWTNVTSFVDYPESTVSAIRKIALGD
jgi:hypothetical protein